LGKTKKKHAYTKQINLHTINIEKLINKYKIAYREVDKRKPPRGTVAVQGTTNEKIIYKRIIPQGQDMSSGFV
jgi:ribosomal protein S2